MGAERRIILVENMVDVLQREMTPGRTFSIMGHRCHGQVYKVTLGMSRLRDLPHDAQQSLAVGSAASCVTCHIAFFCAECMFEACSDVVILSTSLA